MRRTGTLKTVTTRKSQAPAPLPLLRTCPASRPSGMRLSLLAALLFAALTTGRANTNGSQLKVHKVHVPRIVDPRSVRVELRCEYDLYGHDLYSVNWYRNNNELFRYTPSLQPKRLAYAEGGVNVSLDESDGQKLVLLGHQQDLRKNMRAYEGTYLCEVSTEKTFQTDYAVANVSVAILPQNEPVLEGVQPYYQVGEQLEAICTSGPSLPPAELTFYLNKEKIDRAYTQRNKTLHSVGDAAVSARASISLQLQRRHFHSGSLSVSCRASLPGVVGAPDYRTTKTATLAARNQPLAQEPPKPSAAVVPVGSSVVAVGLLLVTLAMGEF